MGNWINNIEETMQIKQKTYIEVEKDGKILQVVLDADMPMGSIFDALMEIKGYVVDRMEKAHKEELEMAEEKMATVEPKVEES